MKYKVILQMGNAASGRKKSFGERRNENLNIQTKRSY